MASKDNVITSLKHLDQIEEELHVHELLDENWFLIYSFLRGQSRGESYIRTILLNDKGLNQELGELFRTISTLSKEDNVRLGRYIVLVPQNFVYSQSQRRMEELVWACKTNMKVGSIDFWDSYYTQWSLNLILLMLRSCKISDLHTVMMTRHGIANDRNLLIESGIAKVALEVPLSFYTFQREFVECIPPNTRLKKMHFDTPKNALYTPFLTKFSETLQHVELIIEEGGVKTKKGVLDDDLERITEAVRCLSVLKKLKIVTCLTASFRIISSSLEEINCKECAYVFRVEACICPKLLVFRSRYRRSDGMFSGVTPVFKIACKQLDCSPRVDCGAYRTYDIFNAMHPFVGMSVSQSCVIRLTEHVHFLEGQR